MIDDKQIRAARALLQWRLEDLAKLTGLSYQALYNIESGATLARPKNLAAIQQAFEQAGIEFLPDSGIRRRNDLARVIEGHDSYLKVLDDVFHTLHEKKNAEALFCFIDDAASNPAAIESEIRLRKTGIQFRSISCEGNTHLIYPLREYRMLPKEYFLNNAEIIYGEKVATLVDNGKSAIITRSITIAAIRRNSFNFMWTKLPMPNVTTAKTIYE